MSDEKIRKILEYTELSDKVSDFIAEGGYQTLEEESGKTLTDVILDCRKILQDELEEYGVRCNDKETILIDGYRSDCIAYLYEFLEDDNLRYLFSRFSEEEREKFKILLNGDPNDDPAFGLKGIIGFMVGFSSDKKFKHINYYVYDFYVVDEFYKRMWTILLSSNFSEPDDPQTNIEIAKYLEYKFQHIDYVRKAAAYFETLDFGGELDLIELKSRLALHDMDLAYGDNLREIVALKNIKKQPSPDPHMLKQTEDMMMCHWKRSRHHMSFFEGKEDQLTLEDLIEIVCDVYDDQETKDDFIKAIEEIFPKVSLSDETKNKIRAMADRFNIWTTNG